MEPRVSVITLGVRDLARARAFYNALGSRPHSDDEGIVCHNLFGIAFALYPWDELAGRARG